MTREQLLSKWAFRGTIVAREDVWMKPCYAEDAALGTDPDELLLNSRSQWQATDHFQIWYRQHMVRDVLEFFLALGCWGQYPGLDHVTDLMADILETFWEAWEGEIGAHDLIETIMPKVLAERLEDMLEFHTDEHNNTTVFFTAKAVRRCDSEYQAMVAWVNQNVHHNTAFLLGQTYSMLDVVANEGMVGIESPEPDCRTHDLLNWLSGSHQNLHYVTEALCHYRPLTNAFNLLQTAQGLALEDIWCSLKQMLKDLLE